MYNEFFGFEDKPFKLQPDSRFCYTHTAFQRVYASVLRAILEQKRLVLLVGEAGIGKTALLRKALTGLGSAVTAIPCFNPTGGLTGILDTLVEALSLELPDNADSVTKQSQLSARLDMDGQRGRTYTLVVDDAHLLEVDALAELLLFCQRGPHRLQLVLVGLPELIEQPCLQAWPEEQRVLAHLSSLRASEISSYVRYQLRTAGYRGEPLFGADAIQAVLRYAGGIPRRINALCDATLFIAHLEEQRWISDGMVEEAVQHCFLKDAPPPPPVSQEDTPIATPRSPTSLTPPDDELTSLSADSERTLEQALALASHSANLTLRASTTSRSTLVQRSTSSANAPPRSRQRTTAAVTAAPGADTTAVTVKRGTDKHATYALALGLLTMVVIGGIGSAVLLLPALHTPYSAAVVEKPLPLPITVTEQEVEISTEKRDTTVEKSNNVAATNPLPPKKIPEPRLGPVQEPAFTEHSSSIDWTAPVTNSGFQSSHVSVELGEGDSPRIHDNRDPKASD